MDNIHGYVILFLIWLISTILFRAIFSKTRTKPNLPPSPLAFPIIGHIHLLGPKTHLAFHKLSNRYGPIFQLYLGSLPCVVVSSSEIAKEILKTNEISFADRKANTAVSYLTYGSSDFGFAPYGAYWKFIKKLCMSELLNGRMLDQLLPIRQEEINRLLQMIQMNAESGEAVDISGELVRLSSSIITRMSISKRCTDSDEEAHNIRKLVKESSKLSARFNLSDYHWLFKKLDVQGLNKGLKEVRDGFDAILERTIDEHLEARKKKTAGGAPKDILDVLLNILEDESSEIKLTRINIKAFFMDLLSGGTDTSAITAEWVLAELINHPTIMEKARKEIDSVVGKDRVVLESDIANLPYIQAVVKETLRLHTPASIVARQSSESCNIVGYDIPANTKVFVNVWALGRDPKYWDNPLEFNPERFLSQKGTGVATSQLDVRGQNYHLLPFGSGRRGCPGASLALNIVQTTVAALIQCFEWKVGDGRES
ncbi:Cytochrome P450 [Quillaja saponaria]|uniref:Cytochrome P450 n=1 Tax=Quillaja saponaria TaxID=32244 RepID=A0AAD7Q8L8_QUISA|nr:Cytochrome P450 [Quillaja saponaria]